MTEMFTEEIENEQIEGLISNMWPFCYAIQLIIIKLCTKFHNPESSSCCVIFDRKKVVKNSLERKKNNK